MINYSARDGCLTFSVRVVPRASRSEIVGEHDGALRVRVAAPPVDGAANEELVRVAAPPVDGAANEELVRVLARQLRVSRNAIEITAGQSGKLKTVRVAGLESSALMSACASQGPKR